MKVSMESSTVVHRRVRLKLQAAERRSGTGGREFRSRKWGAAEVECCTKARRARKVAGELDTLSSSAGNSERA